MEPGKATAEKNGTRDVGLGMSELEEAFVSYKEGENPNSLSSMAKFSFSMNVIVESSPKNLELAAQQENLRYRGRVPTLESSSSTKEIASPKPDKPPPSPKKPHAKSSFSKSKSRLIETNSRSGSSKYRTENSKSGEDDEEDEENPDIKSVKWTVWVIIEWIVFVCAVGCLIASLTLQKLENLVIWGLDLWKWCVLVLVIFCATLYTRWMMIALLFLIRRKWLLNEKVLYFVYGVRKSVRFFVWLCLVLLAWIFLVGREVQRWRK